MLTIYNYRLEEDATVSMAVNGYQTLSRNTTIATNYTQVLESIRVSVV